MSIIRFNTVKALGCSVTYEIFRLFSFFLLPVGLHRALPPPPLPRIHRRAYRVETNRPPLSQTFCSLGRSKLTFQTSLEIELSFWRPCGCIKCEIPFDST